MAAASPSLAQTPSAKPGAADIFQTVCEARWQAADKNGDGRLDQAEIDVSRNLIPKTIESPASVSETQFADACVKLEQESAKK